ncbi:MAG TPA: MFS transporter, partial [Nitrospinota bacterium]|nr:MFS transporter [Nitrospinota bacterium]
GYVKDTSFTTDSSHLLKVIFEPEFMRLNVTGFIVNMSMIATFFTVPLRLAKSFSMSDLWIIYLPLSVIGAIAMMYSSRRADLGNGRTMLILALSVLSSAFLMLFVGTTLLTTLGGFALFFGAFSVLEAILPATVSKLSHPEKRGVTIGVYNLFQFSGTFFGGIVAGWLYAYSENAIFSIMMALTFISVALIATSKKHRVEIANRNNSK